MKTAGFQIPQLRFVSLKYMTLFLLHCCLLQIKRLIKGDDAVNEVTVIERFAAGSSAGAVSQTIIYPMEVGCKIGLSL